MKDVLRENMRNDIMIRKNKIEKQWIVLAGLLLTFFLLTGCGSEKEKVEITFIHGFGTSEDTHVAMRRIYQDFEKEYPDIKLNMISMPSSEVSANG